jgi:hypothetical protein
VPKIIQNEIVCVIGPKGSGKTHEVLSMIREMDRVVIFDMIRDKAYAKLVTGSEDGVSVNPRNNNNVIIDNDYAALATAISKDKSQFKVIYRPSPKSIKMTSNGIIKCEDFGIVTKMVYLRGDCWYIVDEAHLICNSHNCPPDLMLANFLGRHQEMSMVFVAQSYVGIHPNIRRNADTFKFWKIIEPSDLESIGKRCGKDTQEKVQNLRVLERDKKTKEFIREGQMLKWDKLDGTVTVTE